MGEAIKLMENTKVKTFSVYNQGVFDRNRRDFRVVPANEITVAMCKSAGISPDRATVTEEVKKEEPVKAPTPTEPLDAPIVDDGGDGRPNIEDWDEDKLRAFTQEQNIPIHPQAREPGLRNAIDRFYNDKSREGNQSVGNGDPS